jgi:hypothetical protein
VSFHERFDLAVTRLETDALLPSRVRVAHLSDLHTSGLNLLERRLLALLEEESPDLIVISGDTIAASNRPTDTAEDRRARAATRLLLERLRAPMGVYLVRGNWEVVRGLPDDSDFYASVGIRLLVNESVEVRRGLFVVGIDDLTGRPDSKRAFSSVPDEAFSIAVFHSPSYWPEVEMVADVGLAGHTHGGQVRIPLIRPFWLPAGSGSYLEGWYAGLHGALYVSRGLGTSLLPIRFLARPEVLLLTLEGPGRTT